MHTSVLLGLDWRDGKRAGTRSAPLGSPRDSLPGRARARSGPSRSRRALRYRSRFQGPLACHLQVLAQPQPVSLCVASWTALRNRRTGQAVGRDGSIPLAPVPDRPCKGVRDRVGDIRYPQPGGISLRPGARGAQHAHPATDARGEERNLRQWRTQVAGPLRPPSVTPLLAQTVIARLL